MRHLRPALAALAFTCLATGASAQEAPRKPYMFGMTANHMSIAPAAASGQLVGARSWGMQFDGGFTFGKYLVAGIDFAPQFLSDRASFTQTTTGGDKSSSAMLVYFSALAGARTAPLRLVPGLAATSFGMYGGGSATKGERSIDNCVDCFSEKIVVDGGAFVQPTIVFGEGTTRLRVSDRYFPGGKGISSVISVGLELGGL